MVNHSPTSSQFCINTQFAFCLVISRGHSQLTFQHFPFQSQPLSIWTVLVFRPWLLSCIFWIPRAYLTISLCPNLQLKEAVYSFQNQCLSPAFAVVRSWREQMKKTNEKQRSQLWEMPRHLLAWKYRENKLDFQWWWRSRCRPSRCTTSSTMKDPPRTHTGSADSWSDFSCDWEAVTPRGCSQSTSKHLNLEILPQTSTSSLQSNIFIFFDMRQSSSYYSCSQRFPSVVVMCLIRKSTVLINNNIFEGILNTSGLSRS